MKWFEVTLWSSWWVNGSDGGQLADCTAHVQARSAFAAVEGLMRHHGMRYAAYVAAYAEDRSIVYHGYRVRVRLEEASRIGEMVGYDVFRTRRKPVRSPVRKKGGSEEDDYTAIYPAY